MMQVAKKGQHYLLCKQEDVVHIPEISNENKYKKFNGVYIFTLNNTSLKWDEKQLLQNNLVMKKYLDNFYLCLPIDDIDSRQKILDVFFNFIGRDYESIIDQSRNLININNLLDMVLSRIRVKNPFIIDYGCGTGLSIEAGANFHVKMMGFDRSDIMLKEARSKGMKVLNMSDLISLKNESIDGIISSYVLHFEPHKHELELLAKKLRIGGVIAANFHKNRGVDYVKHILEPLNFSVEKVNPKSYDENHGEYFIFIKKCKNNLFLSIDESINFLNANGMQINRKEFDAFIDYNIISVFRNGVERIVLKSDLESLILEKKIIKKTSNPTLFQYIGDHPLREKPSSFEVIDLQKKELISAKLRDDMSKRIKFSQSAYYMGSKQKLAKFLVNVIHTTLGPKGIVVDLMCGSGAASGIFSMFWKTYASDALKFCRMLATVQGGGFSQKKAKRLLEILLPITQRHVKQLSHRLEKSLEDERRLFHSEITDSLFKEYDNFIKTFPLYPNAKSLYGWNPADEVKKRKNDRKKSPYCLFTAYYTNVYFGLQQSIEIDSLRYAIDQIKDRKSKTWALGSLIAAMSYVGTTYAGHFAQPVNITKNKLVKTIEKRSQSVIHEFSIRLLSLAQESEKNKKEITVVEGPAMTALDQLYKTLASKRVLVYLDAPYKREDYSRYYHILETMVSYSYPSSIGTGRLPDIKIGERFRSEFATRDYKQLENKFIEIISKIIKNNWICVWSYSDSGNANIVNVINTITSKIPCTVRSFSVRYQHQSQGRRKPKPVTEYAIVFIP